MRLPSFVILTVALSAAAVPEAAESQRRPGSSEPSGWLAPQLGPRFGYDNSANATVVGAQLRVPIVPRGWLELVPSADVTFLTGLRQYQLNVDAVAVLGTRGSGLYAGGGVAYLNTIFDGPDRETRTGANVVVGLTSRGIGSVPFGTQFEVRYTFLDDVAFEPRVLTLGVNFPLWGWGGRRSGSR